VTWKAAVLAAAIGVCLAGGAHADNAKVLAHVNGHDITDADVAVAEQDFSRQLASVPPDDRRRILIEHLIETELLADAAEQEKLDSSEAVQGRLKYYRRQVLRDHYFEQKLQGSVSDAEAKSFYDEKIGAVPAETEVRASHILVPDEDTANDIREKLSRGGDFAALAKEFSKDPGSAENGGDLGYFTKGQMVEPFASVAFKLEKGEISDPVQTQFGWHIIKVEDKRQKAPPSFDTVKDQIVAYLVQEHAQKKIDELRSQGKVEIVDPDLKKAVEDARKETPEEKPEEKP
jgi:peptidyl-prolyl cis-trans isomerase C